MIKEIEEVTVRQCPLFGWTMRRLGRCYAVEGKCQGVYAGEGYSCELKIERLCK